MATLPPFRHALKLGFIVPSSNTAVETLTPLILHAADPTILCLFTRVPVTTLAATPTALAQFTSPAPFLAAARLLADAGAAVISWHGTAGMFTGGDAADDRALAAAMTEAAGGTPCTTNTLATLVALRELGGRGRKGGTAAAVEGVRVLAIATPYPPALTERVAAFFTGEGFEVRSAVSMTVPPGTNQGIVETEAEEIRATVRRAVEMAGPGVEAVLVPCTNWPAAPLVEELERELGIPVLDSLAVGAWHALRTAGWNGNSQGDMSAWGSLLKSLC